MTLWMRLLARLGQVETRHWIAMGASALLHLAVVLGLRQAPPPPPETVSFEIALQPPEEALHKPPKSKATAADRHKPRKLAQARKLKPKVAVQEPPSLEAAWLAEKQPRKEAPPVTLPPAQTRVAEAAQAPAKSLPQPPQEPHAGPTEKPQLASTAPSEAPSPPAAAATAGANETTAPIGAGMLAGGAAAASGEAGLALAAARSMALAPGGGDLSQGAQASASPDQGAPGAHAGGGPANFSASGGVGGGLHLAAGTGAHAHAASPSTPLAGGEPQGLRLTASGTLSSLPEFPQGKGALAAGHGVQEAGAPQPADGRGLALASAMAGGSALSPMPGPSAGPGKGGQGTAVEAPAGARQASGPGPAPGRLAGAAVPDRSLSGPAGSKRGGDSSQSGKTLALAPGEPGSGPQWAVLMLPIQTGAPMPWMGGRGAPDQRGGQVAKSVATAPGGGEVATTGGGAGALRPAQAEARRLASLAPRGMSSFGGSEGGRDVAPVAAPTVPAGATPSGGARGMSRVKTADARVVRPDSQVDSLDVLAPSNYCPLPLHAQPDNRPPKPGQDKLELPSYAQNNPSFVYPVMANVYGVEGKLILRVQVLADGTPGQILLKQSSGNGLLDRDAKEQLARWRFNPARKLGQPVDAWVDIPVTYRLPAERKSSHTP